ncbi:unnamed protein product [Linum tenue]|uniref:Uncharacterized protein n=1 Tax=Linum tenue TaxID=586396 RepID=A0AAV0IJ38_9ROSI|nr:unnamed protein product [Linum tenue]
MGELETSCSISSSRAAEEEMEQGGRGGGLLEKQSNRSGGNQEEAEKEVGTEEEEDTQSENQHRNQMSKRRRKKQQQQQMMNGENSMNEVDDGGGGGGGESRSNNGLMVRWERLLPRMVLRVLLVESDDSTRQIIAALLRKCSYRVAAVSDGLKAWKLLKERPHNIDLLLTEVDLPSISGYALLTLMTEHEICKNIPVIMMSKEDSVSTVYKCMMRGAADYLVKPIRRNELRNLWQHVWRRQTQLSRENLPQDESVGQDRAEATSENNVNHSTGDVPCVQKNKDFVEKGTAACEDVDGIRLDNVVGNEDMDSEACAGNVTGEEIDFMGAAPMHISSTHMKSEFDTYGRLDLSLRSSFRGGFEIQPAEGKNSLGHSNASSFTRYTGKQLYLQHSESATVSNPKELAADLDRNCSGITDTDGPSPGRSISPPDVQVTEPATENAIHQQNVLRTQDLVCGMRKHDIKDHSFSSMFPPFQREQSVDDASPPQSPCSPNRLETPVKSSQASDSTNETPQNQDKRSGSSEEDQGHTAKPDQSSSSSLCDGGGGASHTNSMGGYGSTCGSNSDVDQGAMIKAETEGNNNEGGGAGSFTHVKSSTRSVQREAALAKFRLKRKERCFDKKVRYESRKMLAEQRPRVKGQFVRRVPTAPPRLEVEQ